MDLASIINSLISNGEIAQLGFGGLLGFVLGWGFKKLLKLLSVIVAATIAFIGVVLLYLNSQGVITLNYDRLESWIVSAGQWSLGIAEAALLYAQSAVGSLSLVGGLLIGFMFGFKKG